MTTGSMASYVALALALGTAVGAGLWLIFYTMQAEVVHFQGVAILKTA